MARVSDDLGPAAQGGAATDVLSDAVRRLDRLTVDVEAVARRTASTQGDVGRAEVVRAELTRRLGDLRAPRVIDFRPPPPLDDPRPVTAAMPALLLAPEPTLVPPPAVDVPPPPPEPTAAEAPALPRAPLSPLVLFARVLTGVGVFFVAFLAFIFIFASITAARSQKALLDEFRTTIAVPLVPGEAIERGAPVALLNIPAIGLQKVVVEGTDGQSLKEGPGHHRGTQLPGQPGNAVLAGRRTTYGAPFGRLDELVEGDEIEVTTSQGVFDYEVVQTMEVGAGDPDVLADSADNLLTLFTSSPDITEMAVPASGRLAVVAELDGRPKAIVQSIPVVEGEDGLTGDSGALPWIVIWAELLAAAAVITVILYRRWLRWPTYVLTTPVLLALAILLFESLDRLLPATL